MYSPEAEQQIRLHLQNARALLPSELEDEYQKYLDGFAHWIEISLGDPKLVIYAANSNQFAGEYFVADSLGLALGQLQIMARQYNFSEQFLQELENASIIMRQQQKQSALARQKNRS